MCVQLRCMYVRVLSHERSEPNQVPIDRPSLLPIRTISMDLMAVGWQQHVKSTISFFLSGLRYEPLLACAAIEWVLYLYAAARTRGNKENPMLCMYSTRLLGSKMWQTQDVADVHCCACYCKCLQITGNAYSTGR